MSIENYSSLGLEKINESSMISDEDNKTLITLAKELEEVFYKKETFRTEFLARNSVLNDVKFPDAASKYWQAVREQDSQFSCLVIDSLEFKKCKAEIEIMEAELDEIIGNNKKSNAQRKLKLIEIEERKFFLLNRKQQSHHRVREIAMWEKIKNECIKNDPSFDRNNVETNQAKSFLTRWKKENNIAMLTNQKDLFRHTKASLESIGGGND